MQRPRCCGRDMNLGLETLKFWEAHCDVCGDVVYVRKNKVEKPQMLDD